jgi:hypothetical protein
VDLAKTRFSKINNQSRPRKPNNGFAPRSCLFFLNLIIFLILIFQIHPFPLAARFPSSLSTPSPFGVFVSWWFIFPPTIRGKSTTCVDFAPFCILPSAFCLLNGPPAKIF